MYIVFVRTAFHFQPQMCEILQMTDRFKEYATVDVMEEIAIGLREVFLRDDGGDSVRNLCHMAQDVLDLDAEDDEALGAFAGRWLLAGEEAEELHKRTFGYSIDEAMRELYIFFCSHLIRRGVACDEASVWNLLGPSRQNAPHAEGYDHPWQSYSKAAGLYLQAKKGRPSRAALLTRAIEQRAVRPPNFDCCFCLT